MAKEYRIYYRTGQHKTVLVFGSYTDNGAKHAKMSLLQDYLGPEKKGEPMKVLIAGCSFVTAKVNPNELRYWEEADPQKIERMMRNRMNRKFELLVQQLQTALSDAGSVT